ncbi:MAG: aspartate aminotransferase family protein [Limnochordaceae bacterium]|nr:aspartate aminotransferase family protein [Limnochordaceae bacterium]
MLDNHRRYGNSGLVQLIGLVGYDRLFVRAEGVRVWDEEGTEYLDFLGGYGALNLGHNHPRVLAAWDKVAQWPNLLQATVSPITSALLRDLALLAPGDLQHSFLCNSGAEAVEGALKLARLATGHQRILYCQGGFHGKTMGALSVTGRPAYQRPFAPLVPLCEAVPFGEVQALEQALAQGEPAAAFIVEPIQGEGGVVIPPTGYLAQARELCHRYGALLIVDEIQTGFGRTGTMFACEAEQVVPDVLCLSKSLGGGVVPIGAFMTTERLWNQAFGGIERCRIHTSTFGGNTRAAASALAALEAIVEEDLPTQAREKGEYFLGRLQELAREFPLIREVRGRGLLIGIEFVSDTGIFGKVSGGAANHLAQEYLASLVAAELLQHHHVITAYTLNNPNVIRLEPPLVVSREELDRVVEALRQTLSRHKGMAGFALSAAGQAVGRWAKQATQSLWKK